jgi:transcriptional regulator with XRE-family HTH domain
METLKHRLERLRKEKGLTQRQLAELANTNQQTIDKIEKGTTKMPRLELFESLSGALGVSKAYLAFGEENKQKEQIAA